MFDRLQRRRAPRRELAAVPYQSSGGGRVGTVGRSNVSRSSATGGGGGSCHSTIVATGGGALGAETKGGHMGMQMAEAFEQAPVLVGRVHTTMVEQLAGARAAVVAMGNAGAGKP